MPDLSLVRADTLEPAAVHAAFSAAFADYLIGPFTLPLAQWPQFTGRQGVDLGLSRVALRGDAILAFALVAPRAGLRIWRLATMAAVPAARGSGAAPALLDDFIGRAARAGMAQVELECFAQNERALRLYRGRGFRPLHELHGYAREADAALPDDPAPAASPDVTRVVAVEEAFGWLARLDLERGDLPLQVTPVSLRALPVELQAWRAGDAQLVFAASGAPALTIHSLVDRRTDQRDAEALLQQLLSRYPRHRMVVPQLQRPDLGGEALQRLGFARQPLHQLMLRRRP